MIFPVTALLLGLFGSLHCIGMCGPIALALPLNRKSFGRTLTGSLTYNFGKGITYAALGAITGAVGSAVSWAGGQQILSVVMGSIILLILLLQLIGKRLPSAGKFTTVMSWLRNKMGALFSKHSLRSLFFIGLLNGLLPCGLVYAALAGAASTGNVADGALFMFLFGAGTAPVLLTLSLAGSRISIHFREKLRKLVPVFIGIMALLLVLRGMGLGIPYISPEFADAQGKGKPHACCERGK